MMVSMGRKKTWRWRVADRSLNSSLGLLYEPGNWGDILKGDWAIRVARALAGTGTLRVIDPYAGFAEYPAVEAVRKRLEALPTGPFTEVQRPFLERGALASTSRALLEVARADGAAAEIAVFDADPVRLESWNSVPGATRLPLASGEEVVARMDLFAEQPALVLIDPYDLFDHFELFLPGMAGTARRCAVLFYCYDKAPRGPGQTRVSLALHREMDRTFRETGGHLTGRIPADAGLARAYHEVFLAGPPDLLRPLASDLARSTRLLARHLAELGCFEDRLSSAGG